MLKNNKTISFIKVENILKYNQDELFHLGLIEGTVYVDNNDEWFLIETIIDGEYEVIEKDDSRWNQIRDKMMDINLVGICHEEENQDWDPTFSDSNG